MDIVEIISTTEDVTCVWIADLSAASSMPVKMGQKMSGGMKALIRDSSMTSHPAGASYHRLSLIHI